MNKIFMTKRKYNGEVAVCSELTRTRGKMKSLVVAVATAIVAMAAMPNAEAAAASVVIDSNANAQEKYLAHFFDYDPKGQDEWGNVIGTYKAKSGYLSTPNEFNGERHPLPNSLATFLSDPEETLPSDEFNGAINAYNYNDAGAKFSKPDPTLATRDETKLDDNYSNTLTFTKPGVTLIGTASRGNSFNIQEKDVVLTIQDTDNTTAVAVTGPLSISSTATDNPATKGIGKHTDYTIGLNYDTNTLGIVDGKLTVISAPNTSGGTTGGGTTGGGTGGSTTDTDKSAKVEGSGGLVVVTPSATTSKEGITDVTTYTVSLNQGTFNGANADGKLNDATTAGVATVTDVVNVVNAGSFKTQVDGTSDKQVKFGDTVNFIDGSGVDVTRETDGSIKFNALVDGTTIKVGDDGKLTVISAPTTTGGGTATTIAAGKNTTVEGTGTADDPYKIHAEKTTVSSTPDTSAITVTPTPDANTGVTDYAITLAVDENTLEVKDGKLTSKVVDTDKSAKVEGSDLVTVTPSATTSKEGITDVTTYTVAVKKGTFAANDGGKLGDVAADANGVATVTDVITAVNQTGFMLKTSENGGENKTTGNLKTNGELINPADTVTMVAGKNMAVTHEADGKITYATKDDVEFTTVKVGKDENGKKPVELKTEAATAASNNPADKTPTTALSISSDGKPTQLTGVGSVLNTKDVDTNPDGKADTAAPTDVKLVNLVGDTINSNAAATVGDLQNMGWVVSATGNEYKDTVKNANQVDFKGTGLAKVTGETDANGVRTITVDVKAAEVDTPVIYTDNQGNKLVKGEDGKFYKADELKDAVYDSVAKTYKKDNAEIVAVDNSNVIAAMNDGDNTADTPKSLSNVKGNLTPTYNVGDNKIGATGSTDEGKPTDTKVTEATKSEVAPTVENVKAMYNNAATVGDVLNAGFNLKANDDAVDFVKPYDTVKFQDGFGTLVTTQTDVEGKETTIQIDIANGYITPDENTSGKVKGPVTGDKTADQLVEAIYAAEDELAVAEQELTADPDNETKKQAVEAAKTKVAEAHKAADDAGLNLVATAQNVADAINKSGFMLKTSAATGGKKLTTGTQNDGELINPADTVEMIAGKNLSVQQDTSGKVTYATKDEVEFTKVTLKPSGNDATKAPSDVAFSTSKASPASNNAEAPTTALNITSSDNKPTQITGIGSVLNTKDVATDKDGNKVGGSPTENVKLVNLTETGVNPNAAATVGDLQNMGWVVKASSNEYSDVVKNANEVEFKGVGLDVSGETATDGKRVITIKALDPNNMLTELIAELENNPGGTGTAQPTGKIAIQKDGNASGYANAGNVKDMVNAAGWQLLADGERKELINAGDRVNFTKGTGTTVNVTPTTEGDKLTGATVSFNVDTGTIAVETKENKETGKVVGSELAKGKTLAEAEQALKEAKDALTALGENADTAAKEAATAKVAEAQKVVDAFNKVATVENVVNAINNAGWNVKAAADGGSVSGTAADELVKAGETVELKAGKNINIKQDGQNFTFSTVENPDFTTVTVGSPTYQDAQGNPVSKKGDKFYNEQGQEVPADQVTSTTPAVTFKADTATAANVNPTDKTPSTALNITSVDGKPTQITGVGSVLNTQDVDTNPDGKADTPAPTDVKLVNLVGDTINSNAAATVGDLQNMGWIVSTKDGNGYLDTVKNANQVDFKGTGLATVKGETVNGVRTITVDVNAQKTVEAADTPVIYTDKDGNKLIKVGNDFYPADSVVSSDGKVYPKDTPLDNKGLAAADIPTANPVEKANVIASMNDGDNKADTPKQLSNVKGNLTPTYNVGDNEIAANGDNAGKPTDTKVTQATKSEVAPTVENVKAMYNNAATVGDVLNAGFNLKANDDAVDFVKPYDTVNFANGTGTLVDVSTDADGKVSTIKVNVDKGTLTAQNGKLVGSDLKDAQNNPLTAEKAQEALDAAKAELAAVPENAEQTVKDAAATKVAEAQKAVDAFNKVATVENVVDAVNKSGFTLITGAVDGGTDATAEDTADSKLKSAGELINPADTVTMQAGKNMTVKHEKDGKITYATKDEVEFTKVTLKPSGTDATKAPSDVAFSTSKASPASNNAEAPTTALNITSSDNKPTQITGVGSVLNTTTVNTNPDGKADTPVTENKLVDLTGTDTAPVNKTAAATVGDLQNMGWIVSAAGNEYKDTVKNANEVEFKGVGLDVSGETAADGKRVITIKAPDSNNTVQINAGKNIEVTRGDQNVTIATSMTPEFTTVNATDSIAVTNGPSMSVNGIDAAGKQITNVAAGVAPTDAVNVSQLKGLTANIDNRIDDVELDARRGAALAGALGMLPQPHISGKSMFSAAATTYSGEQVVAVGYSRLSDNGQHIIKFSGSTNLQGSRKAMMGVAYGYQY